MPALIHDRKKNDESSQPGNNASDNRRSEDERREQPKTENQSTLLQFFMISTIQMCTHNTAANHRHWILHMLRLRSKHIGQSYSGSCLPGRVAIHGQLSSLSPTGQKIGREFTVNEIIYQREMSHSMNQFKLLLSITIVM